jgi:hypothetical protein
MLDSLMRTNRAAFLGKGSAQSRESGTSDELEPDEDSSACPTFRLSSQSPSLQIGQAR